MANQDAAHGVPFGRYVIRSRLGRGGMGEVFLADQLGPLGPVRPVALKRMLPQFARDESALGLFLEEMGIAAQLNHPNIATTYDFGEIEGVYFLAMEFVDGLTLQALLQKLGPLPIREAAVVLRRVAEALAYAHALKVPGREIVPVVHSDVSPQNVMISTQGAVKLLDFGVARAEAAVQKGPGHGKIAYAAPEQMRGEPPDRRFDVWALGVVLYEALSGVRPFRGKSALEILEKAEKRSYQPIHELREDAAILGPIIERALEPDPAERFADAEEMARAFLEFEHTYGTVANEDITSLVQRAGPDLKKEPIELTGTGIAMALASPLGGHITASSEDETAIERAVDPIRSLPLPQSTPADLGTPPSSPRSSRPFLASVAVAGFLAAFVFWGLHRLDSAPDMEVLTGADDDAPARLDQPPARVPREPAKDPGKVVRREISPTKTGDAPRPRGTRRADARRAAHADERKEEAKGGLGVLSVRSVPWSKVALDGQSLGEGIVAAKPVPAGKHTLVLTPGDSEFPARVVDLEIKVGVVTKVFVDFRANSVRIDPQ